MKPILKKIGWIVAVVLGCKAGVHAQEPKMVTKPYKNTIVGIIEEKVEEGYIFSLALDHTPIICNEISNTYEESIDPYAHRYFIPLTSTSTQYLHDKLEFLHKNFNSSAYSIKVSFTQFPLPGILVVITCNSEYTIQKNINNSTRQISFIIKK